MTATLSNEFYKNKNGHLVEIKKHGRKTYSLFLFGLIFLAMAGIGHDLIIDTGLHFNF